MRTHRAGPRAWLTTQAWLDEYIASRRVPVIGGDTGSAWYYQNPMYFPQASTADANFIGLLNSLAAELIRKYPFHSAAHANRLAYAYGTRASKVLGHAKSIDDLGQSFGATLTEREVKYLMSSEWALTADDIVWRRSKLGLRLSPAEIAAIDDWIAAYRVAERPLLEAGGRT